MKNPILICVSLLVFASICVIATSCNQPTIKITPGGTPLADSVMHCDSIAIASLSNKAAMLSRKVDSLLHVDSTLTAECDTAHAQLLHANVAVVKCRKFVGIVRKNPTQLKFLLGWISQSIDPR